ncbi:MAG: cytochrome c oxidase assembly protein [Chloroflexota bacterium]
MSTDPSLFTVLTAWTFEPSVLLGLILSAVIYVGGVRELKRRGRLDRSVAPRHMIYFGLGLLAILLSLESPIDRYSSQLLWMHMIQHLLLLMIAPPLLLLGKPIPVMVVGAPRPLVQWLARSHARTGWFKGLTHLLINPWFAWFAFTITMGAWHIPSLYDAALRSNGVHLLEHSCFLITGILFWWVVIQPYPGRPRVAYVWRVLFVAAAMLPETALGFAYILIGTPLYPFYAVLPRLWGISVLDDQGLAGNIMMVGGDSIMVIAAIPLVGRMMERFEELQLARFSRIEQARLGAVQEE